MFDYIIIGAGSAGCVLANRLTADPQTTVLLLEAGGPDNKLEIKIPAAFFKLFKSDVDWNYETEPQPHLNGRQLYWPRGKVLGGSSSINAMIYIRGHHRDYDRWAELGNETWGFEDVLPYFKVAQNQERGASLYHGVGGPLNVADLKVANPLSRTFVKAGLELGFANNEDFNGAEQEGFGLYQVNQKQGMRHSAAAAYLKPVLKRPNLTVLTHAQAMRICLEGRRAVGVEYMHQDQVQIASAGQEVILCGGAINSPQLLMLSGIGPAQHLQEMDIKVVTDLPGVGQNLQDHVIVPFIFESTQPITLDDADSLTNLAKFLLFKKGPLTSNVAEAGAFIKTTADLQMPDIQYHFGPTIFLEHGFSRWKGYGISIGPTLIHPHSRGHIRLQSSYPFLPPRIQPNYFAEEVDMIKMIAGLRLARQLMHTTAFAPFRGPEILPGPDVQDDDAWRAYVQQRVETLYHPVGTCKMGQDPMAVVDAELRVHTIDNLRVVDGSVMPTIVGGNTNAPIIMIAEKIADSMRKY